MKRIAGFCVLAAALVFLFSVGTVVAGEDAKKDTENAKYTLLTLTENIADIGKKEIVLSGTIVGVCKSGCKMWIAEGDYKEGDPFALVRAKDDAFKFDTDATGTKVVLSGFAVAKYMDYCSESGEEQEGAMDKCETPVGKKAHAEHAAKKESKKETAEKPKLKDVTFFATKVKYL